LFRLCLVVVLQVLSLSPPPLQREPFLRLASLEQGVVLDHRDITSTNLFCFNLPIKTLYFNSKLNL
jgi:hypothetical protein